MYTFLEYFTMITVLPSGATVADVDSLKVKLVVSNPFGFSLLAFALTIVPASALSVALPA